MKREHTGLYGYGQVDALVPGALVEQESNLGFDLVVTWSVSVFPTPSFCGDARIPRPCPIRGAG